MFWVLKDEQEVRQVNQLGRDNSICKASACGRPWVCVCVCVDGLQEGQKSSQDGRREGMTRFTTARLPRALYSILTRSNLILMVVAGEPQHDFTQGSDQSTNDHLRAPEQLSSIQGRLPLFAALEATELKSLISRQVSQQTTKPLCLP